MPDNTIVYISWIHWIGKTTLCKKIAEKTWMNHIIASSLLKKYRPDFGADKSLDGIESDVDAVLFGLKQEQDRAKSILFDWHFVLSDRENNLIKIKKYFFSQAGMKEIVILIDDISNIRMRLKERDGKDFSLDFLERFQNQELEYSREIADMLHIPHRVFDISESGLENIEEVLFNHVAKYAWTIEKYH